MYDTTLNGSISYAFYIFTQVKIVSRGSRPHSIERWVGDDFRPVPIHLELAAYTELITDKNVEASDVYGFSESLNATAIREILAHGNKHYREIMMEAKEKEEEEKASHAEGCGISDNCGFEEKCVPQGETPGYKCKT